MGLSTCSGVFFKHLLALLHKYWFCVLHTPLDMRHFLNQSGLHWRTSRKTPLWKKNMSGERNIYRETWNSQLREDTPKTWENWSSLLKKGQTSFKVFIFKNILKLTSSFKMQNEKQQNTAFKGKVGSWKLLQLNSKIPSAPTQTPAVRLDFSTEDSSHLVEPSGESALHFWCVKQGGVSLSGPGRFSFVTCSSHFLCIHESVKCFYTVCTPSALRSYAKGRHEEQQMYVDVRPFICGQSLTLK